MHVCREPKGRPKSVHNLLGSRVPQPAVQALLFEMALDLVEAARIPVVLDPPRPVVAQADVDLLPQQQQLPHVDLTHVVEALDVLAAEGQALVVRQGVVVLRVDAAHAGDPQGPEAQDVGGAEVVDVGCDPAAVVELPEVRARLVVPADEDGQVGGLLLAPVVRREVAQLPVLGRHRHDGDVRRVAHGLEVAADDEQVYVVPAPRLAGHVDGGVHGVESPMSLHRR